MAFGLEARSYAFLMLCAVNMALLFCACLDRLNTGKPGLLPRLAGLSTVSALGAAFHFFGILLAMAIFLVLSIEAVFVHRRRAFAVLGLGAVTNLLACLWLAVQFTLVGNPGNQSFWFELTLPNLMGEVQQFVIQLFGKGISASVVGGVSLLAIFLVSSRRPLSGLILRLITICAIVTAAATIVSLFQTPVLLARYFTVLIPVIYIAVTDAWFRGIRPLWSRWFPPAIFTPAAMCFVTLGLAASWPSLVGHKEDWRRPAQVLNSLPECRGMPLVVIGGWRITGTYVDLYAHYLSPDMDFDLIEINLGELESIPWPILMASQCPVKIWGAHLYYTEKQVIDSIMLSGNQLKIMPFKVGLLAIERNP
jgi:hypothetical protein